MAGLGRLLAAAVLVLAFAGAAQAATDIRINPVPPQVQPQWTPVPNAPGVEWAPNIPTDVFRHGTNYYFYWEHFIFQGSSPSGPWKLVHKLPSWFSKIDPSYYKTMLPGPPPGSAGPPAGSAGSAGSWVTPGPAPAAPEALPPAAPLPPPPGEAPSPPPGAPNLPKVM